MPEKSTPDKPKAKATKARGTKPAALYSKLLETYGTIDAIELGDALDKALFVKLIGHMTIPDATKAYNAFKSNFVDWNEVRISSAKDVQEVVKAADEPLEVALALKDFLNRLFEDHHHLGLEFLREKSISEIRSFFKKSQSMGEAPMQTLMNDMKEYPVLPIETWMQPLTQRLGLTQGDTTPLQQQKDLFQTLNGEPLLDVYAALATHARTVCTAEDGTMNCPQCVVKRSCPHTPKTTARSRKK